MIRDPYEVLGVARDADAKTIKKSYRKLAAKYHPDQNPDDPASEEQFKEIAAAYGVIGDTEKRARYDQFGHTGEDSPGFGGGFPGGSEVFSDLFDMFGRGARGADAKPDSSLRVRARISFVEMARGCEKALRYKRLAACGPCSGHGTENGLPAPVCSHCGGSGQVAAQRGFFAFPSACGACSGEGVELGSTCSACRSRGVREASNEVTLRVPPGIADGSRLRVRGGGHFGRGQAQAGHLMVEVHVAPHRFFELRDKNLHCEVPIHFTTAALGGHAEVPTVDGSMVRMNVPAGTQNGTEFRLRGKGVGSSERRGHQIVRVCIQVPKKLTPDQRQVLERFAQSMGDEPAGEKSFWKSIADLLD
jgi:molecular chaperone DnaJ